MKQSTGPRPWRPKTPESTKAGAAPYDLASDYQAERDAKPDDPNSCSSWPQTVVDRYNREGP